jgi:hypothetical protein
MLAKFKSCPFSEINDCKTNLVTGPNVARVFVNLAQKRFLSVVRSSFFVRLASVETDRFTRGFRACQLCVTELTFCWGL